MKKYCYGSILLGAFALSACNDDEANNKKVTEKSLNTEQSIVINNKANTAKAVEAAPFPLSLTQEEKEEYYRKYVEILEKLNAENNKDFELEIEPITAFLDEYWIEVTEFEKLAKARADASIGVSENKERYDPISVPKTVKLQIGSKETTIIFDGSFDTQLSSNTPEGIQLFSAFKDISSEAENAEGTWTQFGNVALLKDGGVTYDVEISGKYFEGGIISTHTMALKFNCNKYGGIN